MSAGQLLSCLLYQPVRVRFVGYSGPSEAAQLGVKCTT
jgi:hypothetical protein